MSAQKDCEFLVKRARELVPDDPCAAKAWLITARTLYPADFNIQYEMYTIERNAERTSCAGRLLYDMFLNFPDQPVVWREISVITAALRSDAQDKHSQFLRGLFETLPGRIQCEMLLKATEQCFNTLEKAEMLLLLLKRFPESVVQHGVSLGETLLEAETSEKVESPVNCFRKLFVCDVLPLVINNMDMRLPASLMQKYILKAAEFYIGYVTRGPSPEGQINAAQEGGPLKSPSVSRGSQRYVIDGLSEKSSAVAEPWERLLDLLAVVGARCEWQGDKGQRSYVDLLQRVKELCRYLPSLEGDTRARCCSQVVICTALVLFRNAFLYVSTVQPALFQGVNTLNLAPWILVEDFSTVYNDVEVERGTVKHTHKKRKMADGREKTMSSDDEDALGKVRGRHILVNKTEMANWSETLEGFYTARESWDLLHSHDSLETEFKKMCASWKTESWLWFRIFLTDMIIYQGQYRKALSSLHQMAAVQQPQSGQQSPSGQTSLEHHRALIQQASCHYALGEYRIACEKLLDVVSGLVPPNHEATKPFEDQTRPKSKMKKSHDLRLLPCTSNAVLPFCLQLMLACFKPRAFTDNRDDLSLGHVVVLLQYDWPQGEMLFLKAVDKICQQGGFQYENFFNYVTNIDMLEEFAYLRTPDGGRIQLELLPNQGMLIKNPRPSLGVELNTLLLQGVQMMDRHHTVTRGITKGVKEDFRLAMERQVSRCGENLLSVLHRFCINEKIIIVQSLP
ncbi:integrator complex subunit 10 isoform X1 [Corythoichthys intestinalis]|uniref:integrator complex subunit 10 isoform X1 n=1 Tax=Corythoichthys intestinalis TaxID=161448 RepID=UPI0025A5B944|nr:integrator complex subunit 10 isoform X1 [Corythoichthys intestinalis]XP_061792869.1 integrator complex subunit 10-like isoform X2 [Nerophis lumbriciformis]